MGHRRYSHQAMEPVRHAFAFISGSLRRRISANPEGFKIDTVHGYFVVGTNPSTARGLAIWRRLNHPHASDGALGEPSVVIDGVRLSSANRAISIG